MNSRADPRRVVHISDSPDEHRLLAVELAAGAWPLELECVASPESLRRALARGDVDLIIADLPIPWPSGHDELSELQRLWPEIEVIFRWGEPGARNAEPENAQIERLVAQRLALAPTHEQTEVERRALMRELARRQDVLLRIQRQPLWDFDSALRDVARATAELLDVERVGVWEFAADRSSLRCLTLFKRSGDRFESGAVLESHPRYLRALDHSLSIVAHDCLRDPRTSEFAAQYLAPLGIPSMIDAPIRVDGDVAGVLCVEHVGAPRHWSILDQCAASTLACQLERAFEFRRRREAERRLQALERLDALGRVAGQIAHDFNNRLTVLSGWLGLLQHDIQAGASAEHCLSELERELDRAAAHVRELLSLGAGESPAPQRPADLRSELERQLPILRRVLGEGVDLDVDVPAAALRVPLGARELESILLNLATNARDALAGRGHVRLTVDELDPPAALPGASGRGVRVVFEDDGPGFSEQALSHLFEPLFTTKPAGRGSGLGLSSVARLVRSAGGTIEATNRSAKRGARVAIELPQAT